MALDAAQVQQLAKEFESKSAQEILKWAIDRYGKKIGLASSFGAEDVVLIDMMANIDKEKAHVFTLETGRLNQETYDVMDDVRARYGIKVEAYFPDQKEVEDMIRGKGMNLMYESVENRKLCCEIRKVHPLNRALANLDGWITGLRRDQAATRGDTKKIEIDAGHRGIIKLNPIADWTSDMVWDYIKKNNVPYNKLHDMGYPSIGCEPCTRAVQQGEDPRAGRWWWENAASKECGLHFDPMKRK
ncbi:phosphoadenylyl-sulfate reductase [Candidatus Nitrososphaera sp. FF02]|uniref:phosphoadenylyl-sulfate reductase n=1 Tax=Candidatus Nitrososphaera sp. FF02 TaxID=3398226 RepID=UPI0039EBA773